MNPRRIGLYFRTYARGYLRNPIGLFFALVFPVILILIFGAVFQNSGSQKVDLYTQNLDTNSPVSQQFEAALNGTGAVSLQFVPASAGNLSNWLKANSDTDGLVIPAGFGADYLSKTPTSVTVYWDPAAGAASAASIGAVQGVVNGFNLQAANGSDILRTSTVTVGSQIFTYIDYLIPGLIGFSILTSPMFSLVNVSSTYKKEKLFRQLSLTPLTRAEWLTAALFWYIVLTVIAAFMMITIGQAVFGAHVTFTWASIPFLVLGPFLFVALGMLAGSVSKTPESAAVVGNIITFPMMFLSGTFFPVADFSPGLQDVAHVLPLYYVIDGLNSTMLFGNTTRALTDALIVLVIAVVLFVLAVRAFSWREE
ncbi:MAG: ABC transporter permease [Thermoplasmata archaeon]